MLAIAVLENEEVMFKSRENTSNDNCVDKLQNILSYLGHEKQTMFQLTKTLSWTWGS